MILMKLMDVKLFQRKKRDKFIEIFEDADNARNYQSATGLYVRMLNRNIKGIEIDLQMTELESEENL